jgi:hypothetical protein
VDELQFWLESTWISMARPENGLSMINNQFDRAWIILKIINGQMFHNPGVESS